MAKKFLPGHTKVLEFWGKAERDMIGQWYADLPRFSPVPDDLPEKVANLVDKSFWAARKFYWCKWVDYDPYPTADAMREALVDEQGLYISTLFNTSDIMPGDINLAFRFAHDIDHCMTEGCNFAFRGEVCAYSLFASRTNDPILRSWLFTEIVGQAGYRGKFGEFGEQKLALAPMEWVNTVCNAYGV